MKERLDLKNAGTKLFDEIEKANLNEAIQEAVSFDDVSLLFPEYKAEHIRNSMRVNMAWLGVYAIAIMGLVLAAVGIFNTAPIQDLAIWFTLAGMLAIIYCLHDRIMYMDSESLSKTRTRRAAYALFGFSILFTASLAIGAVISATLFFATLIFATS